MTPTEATILRFLELRGGIVTDAAIAQQLGSNAIALGSLRRHLCLERDRHHWRITTVGEQELG